MDDQSEDRSAKRIPIRDLHVEPGAEELLQSAAMEPYMIIESFLRSRQVERQYGNVDYTSPISRQMKIVV